MSISESPKWEVLHGRQHKAETNRRWDVKNKLVKVVPAYVFTCFQRVITITIQPGAYRNKSKFKAKMQSGSRKILGFNRVVWQQWTKRVLCIDRKQFMNTNKLFWHQMSSDLRMGAWNANWSSPITRPLTNMMNLEHEQVVLVGECWSQCGIGLVTDLWPLSGFYVGKGVWQT